MDPAPHRIGNYELLARLGKGGMAQVWAARRSDLANAPVVAVKKLDAPDDPEAHARFVDEARVLAMLAHPHIATVIEVEVGGPEPYMVMELVDGVDLRTLMQRCCSIRTLPSFAASLTIVAQAALGLDHAHRRTDPEGRPLRLVHRDVSLSNIMVTRTGDVKVVDFGIARSRLSTVHTEPGLVRGKPAYMAPEQCLARHVTHRADIFALGVVLYELTTGSRCFNAGNDIDSMFAVVSGTYTLPSVVAPDFPPSLERVIRIALATDPEHRFSSCAQMVEALGDVMAEQRWMGGPEVVAQMVATAFSSTPAPCGPVRTIRGVGVPFDDQLTRGNPRVVRGNSR
jgi:eukaryotic-like serine/threonine-protein kinase